jgi:integrase
MSLAVRTATFTDVELRLLRRSHLEHWVKGMVSRGLAPGTVHTQTNNVRAVLHGAVADRVIPRDPSEGIALPRRCRAAAAMTLPTPAQVGTILEAADGPFRAFVGRCDFAGLQLSEAAAVRVGDVDFLRRTLAVARQVQRASGGAHDLRHFYASGLIASGCDVVTVQRALGHASATTTLNTYSHLWPTAEDRTRRAAEELFADSCGLGADSATSTSR